MTRFFRDRERLIRVLLVVVIGLGITARFVRLGAGLNLWGDEAYIAVNIVEREPAELMKPLDNLQAAPPGWLWMARGCWVAFERLDAMRFPAMVSGLAALACFAVLARRVLGRRESWWAIAFFAASFPLIRYAVETKPYSGDLLAATLILLCVTLALPPPPSGDATPSSTTPMTKPAWLCALAVLLPVLLWSSFPATIVAIAAGAWVLVSLIRRQLGWRMWLAWGACVLLAGAALFSLDVFVLDSAMKHDAGYLAEFWAEAFPPWREPWRLPWWVIDIHAGKMMGHPVGDKNFGSTFTLLLFLAGAAALWQSKRRPMLALLLAPMAAGIAVAMLGIYPYGGHVRLMLFLSPSICLLAGAGVEEISERLPGAIHSHIWRVGVCVFLIAVPIVVAVDAVKQRVAQNKKNDIVGVLEWINTRAAETGGPIVVCNALDPHFGAGPKIQFELYLMTQMRHPVIDNGRVPWDKPSPGAILHCIYYDSGNAKKDKTTERAAAWRAEIESRASLIAERRTSNASSEKIVAIEYKVSP